MVLMGEEGKGRCWWGVARRKGREGGECGGWRRKEGAKEGRKKGKVVNLFKNRTSHNRPQKSPLSYRFAAGRWRKVTEEGWRIDGDSLTSLSSKFRSQEVFC